MRRKHRRDGLEGRPGVAPCIPSLEPFDLLIEGDLFDFEGEYSLLENVFFPFEDGTDLSL